MMLALAMVTLVEPYLSGANSTGRDGFLWVSASGYPLVMTNIAIENGH